jgi:hypothetical protein
MESPSCTIDSGAPGVGAVVVVVDGAPVVLVEVAPVELVVDEELEVLVEPEPRTCTLRSAPPAEHAAAISAPQARIAGTSRRRIGATVAPAVP